MEDGSTVNVKVWRHVSAAIDSEALRITGLLRFIPGKRYSFKDNQYHPSVFYWTSPIWFRLNKGRKIEDAFKAPYPKKE